MTKPTGKLLFAYQTIANLEKQLADVMNERDELRRQLESLTVEEDREDARKVFVRTNTGQGKSISLDDMLARYAPATDEQAHEPDDLAREFCNLSAPKQKAVMDEVAVINKVKP